MSTHHIRVKFSDSVAAEDVEGLSGIIDMLGRRTYRNHEPRVLLVLPEASKVKVLKEQLTVWQQEGLLSWSDAT